MLSPLWCIVANNLKDFPSLGVSILEPADFVR